MDEIDFARIELLVLDVDGVLTDGRIALGDLGGQGAGAKAVHVRDETGLKYWRRCGRKAAVISGQNHAGVVRWAEALGLEAVRLNAKDKLPVYEEVLAELGVPAQRTAVMGDDLPDLPLLGRCGFPVAVADAAGEVREAAAYVTRSAGGRGAVREVVELVLRRAGAWEGVLARYRTGAAAEGGESR